MTAVFRWPVRVYYEDTDAGGIVFYANYLKFFERARSEWLRSAGIAQQELVATAQRMFVVKSTAMDYHAPAKLDDSLEITVVVEKLGRASVDFLQQAWLRNSETPRLLCEGRVRVGCVDTQSLRPAAIPEETGARIRNSLKQNGSE